MTTKRDRHGHKRLRSLRIPALVASLVLFAQVFAICHALDFKGHSNNEPCKICLSLAGFVAGANVGHAPTVPVIPRAAACDAASTVLLLSHAELPERARGPPLVS